MVQAVGDRSRDRARGQLLHDRGPASTSSPLTTARPRAPKDKQRALFVAIFLTLFAVANQTCVTPNPDRNLLDRATLIPSTAIGIREPSGVAYHSGRRRLFVVGDEGRIAELDHAGRLLRVATLPGDLEDVAVHSPTGDLLVLSERHPRITLLDVATLKTKRRWRLDHAGLLGIRPKSKREGFEGIAYRPDSHRPDRGMFVLAHQLEPPVLVHIAFDPFDFAKQRIGPTVVTDRWTLDPDRVLTAVTYAAKIHSYLVADGGARRLLVLSLEGRLVAEVPLPGAKPEGLCLDESGTLWIADDRLGLWRCPDAVDTLVNSIATQ
jgi:uncharacterized protein YjiK